jgi:fructose/tagatose bisphosphate aldolase
MPIVSDYNQVKDIYQQAVECGVGLPVFCAEDRETLEAILASALKMAEKIGVEDLPIIPAWTCRYPSRGQMTLLTACGDPLLGTQMMFSDLKLLTGENSPYRKLRILPHLDHAFPWLDGDILDNFPDQFASVMCDASEKPFAENIELTARYVEKVKGRVVVEGAVDEIYESGGGEKNEATTVEQVQKYLSGTGVDIVVPNVGTEHRSTADQVVYNSKRAREISTAVGNILCLHGTSSVKSEDLPKIPADGFVKINVYTTLAVMGGQALTRRVLDDLGNIFDHAQLTELVQQGVLGEAVLSESYGATELPIKPKLAHVTNPPRRDAWFAAVRDRCCDFLKVFNYRLFAK